jgi:proteasome lid subunit RPN8/RPN11
MRNVRLPSSAVREIERHARDCYPNECCGFLLARPDARDPAVPREVFATRRAANEFDGERRRRFMIRPDELRALERSLEGTGTSVAGFYHSHPDHPARPSQFDQDHAWPWYTYLVLSVTRTETPRLGAFELDPDSGTFREVAWATTGADDAGVTEGLSATGGNSRP